MARLTFLVDDFEIEVKEGKRVRRDVQIKKRPVALHLYDNESNEISELDFGADEGVVKKTFSIFNGGTQKINYEIEKSADWITNISSTSGTVNTGATKPIVVTIDRKLLAIGDNTTTLLISLSGVFAGAWMPIPPSTVNTKPPPVLPQERSAFPSRI
ncbi:MAG: hypothetical protein J6P73_06725 [Bacteroidales bacterium]|nr:hypothetical protein [Bacteroidales bacterium]